MPKSYAMLDNSATAGRPGKGKKKQREFVGKYLASKGVEKNVAGSRSKREMKLRAEGRGLFAASKKPKKKTVRTSGVTADRSAKSAARTSGRTADSRGRGNTRPRGGM